MAAIAWSFVIALGLVGWGRAALLVRPSFETHRSLAELAAMGTALLLAVGGLLNLFRAISPGLLIALTLAGALYAIPGLRGLQAGLRAALPAEPVARILLLAISLIVVVHWLGSLSSGVAPGILSARMFNPHDDFHGYLPFSVQMAQLGGMEDDSFNARRLMAGYQGQAFLNALAVVAPGLTHIHLFDPGLTFALLIFLTWQLCRTVGLGGLNGAILTAIVALRPPPVTNTSATATGAVLLLALLLHLAAPSEPARRRAWTTGLLLSGLLALKTTTGIAGIACVACGYLARMLRKPAALRTSITEFVLGTAIGIALVVPWAISLWRSSGTLFYPILGLGVDGGTSVSQGLTVSALQAALAASASHPWIIALLACLAMVGFRGRQAASWTFGIGIACLIAVVTVALGTRGEELRRFAYPVILPGWIVVAAAASRDRERWKGWATLVAGMAALAAEGKEPLRRHVEAVRGGLDGARGAAVAPLEETARLRSAVALVPEGERVLVRVARPFLLDFRRNHVSVVDWPGEAAPRPGLGLGLGPDSVAGRIRAAGIRFVLWDYAAEAGDPMNERMSRLLASPIALMRARVIGVVRFHAALEHLRPSLTVYDDGRYALLDLGRPPS